MTINPKNYLRTAQWTGVGEGIQIVGFKPTYATSKTPAYDVASSLRLDASRTTYATRTPVAAGNQQVMLRSYWFKRTTTGALQALFANGNGPSSNMYSQEYLQANDTLNIGSGVYSTSATSVAYSLITTQLFKDTSNWCHLLVAVDTTQPVATNRVLVIANGVQITAFSTSVYPTQNVNTYGNAPCQAALGSLPPSTGGPLYNFNGYLADFYQIDGYPTGITQANWTAQNLAALFGQTDPLTGQWVPKSYTGSVGTQGSHQNFANGTSLASLGYDVSNDTSIKGFSPVYGSVAVSTAKSKFGTSSTYFPGANSFVDLSSVKAEDFTAGDFTVEFWTYMDTDQDRMLCIGNNGPATAIVISSTGFYWGVSKTFYPFSSKIPLGVWSHFAISVSGATAYFFVNGNIVYSTARQAVNSGPIRIGALYDSGYASPYNNGSGITAYLQDFRITKGTGRYTANFAVPTAPAPIGSADPLWLQTILLPMTGTPGQTTLPTFMTNNWTLVNCTLTGANAAQTFDSPTNNFATWNPGASAQGTRTLSNGGLTATNGANGTSYSTIPMNTSRYYAEYTVNTLGTAASHFFGIVGHVAQATNNGQNFTPSISYCANGQKCINGSVSAYGSAYAAGATIGCLLDFVSNTVTFYLNNVSQGAIALNAAEYYFFSSNATGGGSNANSLNCGQLAFKYSIPNGATAVSSKNLTPNTDVFNPDLWILKNRSLAANWSWLDTTRGSTLAVNSNTTTVQAASATGVLGTVQNGLVVGTDFNTAGSTFTAYGFKKGVTPGFDIVTGTHATSSQTFNHGLGVKPSVVIIRDTSTVDNWYLSHIAFGTNMNDSSICLNLTNGVTSLSGFNGGEPTTSTFSVSTRNSNVGSDFVAYLWAEVAGFSKFASYTGNNLFDGPNITCGFKPALVIIKRTDTTSNWVLYDTTRNANNGGSAISWLELNANVAEVVQTDNASGNWDIDILSNGFKVRSFGEAAVNASGGTYVYMAFAEQPFKTANAR